MFTAKLLAEKSDQIKREAGQNSQIVGSELCCFNWETNLHHSFLCCRKQHSSPSPLFPPPDSALYICKYLSSQWFFYFIQEWWFIVLLIAFFSHQLLWINVKTPHFLVEFLNRRLCRSFDFVRVCNFPLAGKIFSQEKQKEFQSYFIFIRGLIETNAFVQKKYREAK